MRCGDSKLVKGKRQLCWCIIDHIATKTLRHKVALRFLCEALCLRVFVAMTTFTVNE